MNTPLKSSKPFVLPLLTFMLLATVPLFFRNSSTSPLHILESNNNNGSTPVNHSTNNQNSSASSAESFGITTDDSTGVKIEHKCNIFSGNWVRYPKGPYYTNETKCVIDDRQNCMKFGRPDTDFMKWRWKPDECELPLFDAEKFLELVRNKTLAFVGDSVGRNQMQSLTCLLASVAIPVDVSYVPDTKFRRWLYTDYNFTIAALWSPLLVKAIDADPKGYSANSLMSLYLDEPDNAWASQIRNVDIVIISAGQWFFRPFIYYEKGKIVGCNKCNDKNIIHLTNYYGYRMAFRTAFSHLVKQLTFKGMTILRTFSPSHFENGDWDKGGNCIRRRPFAKQETKFDGFNLEFYLTQVEEFRAAEKEGIKRALKFGLLDTTEAMVLRPDGHPNHYGHRPNVNQTIADCVHWCMPGPVDTWNEFLLHVLKLDAEGSTERRLEKIA